MLHEIVDVEDEEMSKAPQLSKKEDLLIEKANSECSEE